MLIYVQKALVCIVGVNLAYIISLELPEAVANWPPADIVDRSHLVHPTPFVTVIGKPHLLSFDLHIDTVSTPLPMADTPYQIFSRVLSGLDHTRLRLLGLLTDTLSSPDLRWVQSAPPCDLIPSFVSVQHIVALLGASEVMPGS